MSCSMISIALALARLDFKHLGFKLFKTMLFNGGLLHIFMVDVKEFLFCSDQNIIGINDLHTRGIGVSAL